jgi:hypothetical protein
LLIREYEGEKESCRLLTSMSPISLCCSEALPFHYNPDLATKSHDSFTILVLYVHREEISPGLDKASIPFRTIQTWSLPARPGWMGRQQGIIIGIYK